MKLLKKIKTYLYKIFDDLTGINFFIVCDENGYIQEITNISELSNKDDQFYIGRNIYEFIHPNDLTDVIKEHLYLKGSCERKTKIVYKFYGKNKRYINVKSYAHKSKGKIFIHSFQL
jgi:hypothetical protein